jgi:hypothetical protein
MSPSRDACFAGLGRSRIGSRLDAGCDRCVGIGGDPGGAFEIIVHGVCENGGAVARPDRNARELLDEVAGLAFDLATSDREDSPVKRLSRPISQSRQRGCRGA